MIVLRGMCFNNRDDLCSVVYFLTIVLTKDCILLNGLLFIYIFNIRGSIYRSYVIDHTTTINSNAFLSISTIIFLSRFPFLFYKSLIIYPSIVVLGSILTKSPFQEIEGISPKGTSSIFNVPFHFHAPPSKKKFERRTIK